MNNHEWNPITTAPKGEPILVTDDDSVWFGKIGRFGFAGTDLQDAEPICIYELDNLTGWLPAPATMWEPQKTADQMFHEAGYRRKYERTYENKYGVQIWVCSRWPGHEEFHKAREEELAFSKEEILACAQLIRDGGNRQWLI